MQARVPIWYGGAAERRHGRAGSPSSATAGSRSGSRSTTVTATVERLRAAFVEQGRDPATLGVRQNLAVKTDDDGNVDLAATLAPFPILRPAA